MQRFWGIKSALTHTNRVGQGIIYRHFDGYQREVPCLNETRLLRLWEGHQQKLKDNLCKDALLLDCHSFPEDMGDVDVCIGFNEDWSKPSWELLDFTVNLFEENGYPNVPKQASPAGLTAIPRAVWLEHSSVAE